MPPRTGAPNFLPSKQARKALLRSLRNKAEGGDPIAITGVLLLDHLIRERKGDRPAQDS